ncbi:unnamed protein product [Echinostoma caproni]|uniref:SRP_SPB domain-containing protein n=1 Tax=Echinostoma caproni TaxID=27848 RepID=A0A183BFK3_9TREM|nr:unnamed protein product [Echinostoma caproni]
MDTSLISWFSPRRYTSAGKDQAAKLKRLNTRKIEFDLQELSQSVDRDVSQMTTESLMSPVGRQRMAKAKKAANPDRPGSN